jgi:HD-GYP domain-containing protein (c-di-GMP phosphodiesterase class II)
VRTALTDRRAYRNPLSDAEAFAHMRGFVGRHFEPALFRRYEQLMLDGSVPALPEHPARSVTPDRGA